MPYFIYKNATLSLINSTNTEDFNHILKIRDIISSFELAIAIMGIVLNVGSFFVMLHPKLRLLGIAPYLLSIALSDSIYLQFGVINFLAPRLMHFAIPRNCLLRLYMGNASLTVSNYSIGILAIVRVIVIMSPQTKERRISTSLKVPMILCLWFVSFTIFIPVLLAFEALSTCYSKRGWEWVPKYYPSFQVCGDILLDLLLLVTTPIMIKRLKHFEARFMSNPRYRAGSNNFNTEPYRKVTRLTIGLSLFQLFTNSPGVTLWVCMIIGNYFNQVPTLNDVTIARSCLYLLNTLNHAGNAFVYMICSQTFRKAICRIIICGRSSVEPV